MATIPPTTYGEGSVLLLSNQTRNWWPQPPIVFAAKLKQGI